MRFNVADFAVPFLGRTEALIDRNSPSSVTVALTVTTIFFPFTFPLALSFETLGAVLLPGFDPSGTVGTSELAGTRFEVADT